MEEQKDRGRCHFLMRVHVTSYSSTFASDKYQTGNKLPLFLFLPSLYRPHMDMLSARETLKGLWYLRLGTPVWECHEKQLWLSFRPHLPPLLAKTRLCFKVILYICLRCCRWVNCKLCGICKNTFPEPPRDLPPFEDEAWKVYYEASGNKIWSLQPGIVSAT